MNLDSNLRIDEAIDEANELLSLIKGVDLTSLGRDAQMVEWAAEDFMSQCRDLKRCIEIDRQERAGSAVLADASAIASEQTMSVGMRL